MQDWMTAPGQLIFLQSCPPQLYARLLSGESPSVVTERPNANFIMSGDCEYGVAVMGRSSVFSHFTDAGLELFNEWALWHCTIHLRQPMCNIVALPVATVVALPERDGLKDSGKV